MPLLLTYIPKTAFAWSEEDADYLDDEDDYTLFYSEHNNQKIV